MMFKNNESIDDYLKIYPIKTKIKLNSHHGVNKNFEEFQRVYGSILNKDDSTAKEKHSSTENVRPLIDLKTIRMEMPLLGSEQAIIQPTKKPVISILRNTRSQHSKKAEDTVTSTENLVKKLVDLELPETKTSSLEVNRNPNSFLEQTNKELNIAAAQLEQIKGAMKMKQAESSKGCRVPTHKPKKKNRHSDCVKKKYLTTIHAMKQKLQALENKYFSRPKIAYRSVNDTFTQSSEIETIYEKTSYDCVKTDQTLEGIMNDLDELMNADVNQKYRPYQPRDLSFNDRELEDSLERTGFKLTEIKEPRHVSIHDSQDRIRNEERLRNYKFFSTNNKFGAESEQPPKKKNTTVDKDSPGNNYIFIRATPISSPNSPGKADKVKIKMYDMKNVSCKQSNDPFADAIDISESQVRKFRSMKQDIMDIETFCEEMRKITHDEDNTEEDVKVKQEEHVNKGPFDGSQLQNYVLKSSFLMKEFDTPTKINYFCESDTFSRNKNKQLDLSEKYSGASVTSIKKLLRSLNSALDNSIYEVGNNE
nr:uncharacterized protein LOC111516270 [Leptinotarsa decemlineata]